MKTLILFLFVSFNSFANFNFNTDPKTIKENAILGLNVVTYQTKKLGKHIYVVSNHYTEKKVEFLNKEGKVIYSTTTVGSPISLANFETGIYRLRVTENKATQIIEYVVE